MKTASAWALGATGAGIKVGVVDTGIDTAQPDLKNNISPLSRDMEIGRPNQTIADSERHGTRVSGVIAHEFNGTGTVGVAFKATIISYRADREGTCEMTGEDEGCKLPDSNIARGIDAAVADGVRVINLSLGGMSATSLVLQSALLRATNAGIVVVASAGNDSTDDPEFPAQLASDARFGGLIIAAGSTDSTEALSTFSAKAGNTASNFLVAPGTDIIADCDSTSCWRMSGTSFSAPHISGAIALLLQNYPNLSGKQAVDILYRSARDLGVTGTDAVFGRGIVDLARAFSPIGLTTSSTASGQQVRIDDLDASAGAAFGDAFSRNGMSTGVKDEYQRAFNVSIGYRLRPERNALLSTNHYDRSPQIRAAVGEGYMTFSGPVLPSSTWGFNQESSQLQGSVNGLFPVHTDGLDGAMAISFATGGAPMLGLLGDQAGGRAQFGLMGLAQSDQSSGLVYDHGKYAIAAFTASGGHGQLRSFPETKSQLSFLQFGLKGQRLQTTFELGHLREDGALWGTRWTNNLAFLSAEQTSKPHTNSSLLGLQLDWALNQNLTLTTRLQGSRLDSLSSGGFFDSPRNVYASAALLSMNVRADNGWWRASLEQPLRVETGTISYLLADPFKKWTDDMKWSQREVALAPSGRELRLTLARDWLLARPGRTDLWIGANLTQIHQPQHISGASNLTRIQLTGSKAF